MKYSLLFILLFSFVATHLLSQELIELADNTFKVKGFEEAQFYFGFAQGDKLIFSFEEINGKEISELEIVEMPSATKFMDYKTKKVESKNFNVNKTGIYKFHFKNNSIFARVCRMKIQRIASPLYKNFNSSVYWRTVQDTIFANNPKQYLIKSDTVAQTIIDKVIKVSAASPLDKNADKELVEFVLPKATISWSYFLGVGSESQKAFAKTKSSFLNTAASVASKIPGYGTMAALAMYGINTFQYIQGEENVKYAFITDYKNAMFFKSGKEYAKLVQGNVISDASQMKEPLSGKIYLGLQNDNLFESIEVKLNVTVIVLNQKWRVIPAEIINVKSRTEPYLKN